jgi:L-alanine-DL-glutamate epimerase-like enolase superfamily enzyme
MATLVQPAAPSGGSVRAGSERITSVTAAAYTVPTDAPESDGTFAWDATTIVVVGVASGEVHGLGYSYASRHAAQLVASSLGPIVNGQDAFDIPRLWRAMVGSVRNIGRPGIAATAISAVDNALWDLKARLLDVSVSDLIGRSRDAIPAYGSGGFCSYSDRRLAEQLGGWADAGFRFVKMKVGREPERDRTRAAVGRSAIGEAVELFVDANGAHDVRHAIAAAHAFRDAGVTWFEEPVTSDDPRGLRAVRDASPPEMAIAAGEYAWDADAFRILLENGSVDVLQADATRCLGISGFLAAAALAGAHHVPLSTHCAPALHVSLACATRPTVHLEWFHDHVRLESILFDGAPSVHGGLVAPDRTRPGLGLDLKRSDAERVLDWTSA